MLLTKTITFFTFVMFTFSILSCTDHDIESPAFSFTPYYLAGTLSPTSSSRPSPYLLSFQNDSLATLVSSTAVFQGKYSFKNDSLKFRTNDREKLYTFRVNADHSIASSAYEVRFYSATGKLTDEIGKYDQAAVKYIATGEIAKTPVTNQLLGATYIGDTYKFGTAGVNISNFVYKFHPQNLTYGTGTNTTDENAFTYTLYNNVAFRYTSGTTKEFGVLIGGKLVVFKDSGLFYWGTYSKQ